jgi:CDP-diacylglycerol--glycerol-3-phosphate 3-phosphatidyltransferase
VIGSLVSPALRARVRGLAVPIALVFGRLGLSPNALTLIGFGISMVAAILAAEQRWIDAGVLVIIGGIFDLFDGALARATNRVIRLGAFLDSVFDRAGEAALYVGIALGSLASGFTAGAVLAATAMAASFMVSYTRAKSESLGFTPGTGMANVGIAPREVRLLILTIGLLVAGIRGGVVPAVQITCAANVGGCPEALIPRDGSTVLWFTLALITTLATITAIQRIVHVARQPPPESSTPAGDQHP